MPGLGELPGMGVTDLDAQGNDMEAMAPLVGTGRQCSVQGGHLCSGSDRPQYWHKGGLYQCLYTAWVETNNGIKSTAEHYNFANQNYIPVVNPHKHWCLTCSTAYAYTKTTSRAGN